MNGSQAPPKQVEKMLKKCAIVRIFEEKPQHIYDQIAGEEALEIELNYGPRFQRELFSLGIFLRSPEHDQEFIYGLLFNLGIIENRFDIVNLTFCLRAKFENPFKTRVQVNLSENLNFSPQDFSRDIASVSSCGLCGIKSLPKKINPLTQKKTTISPSILRIAKHNFDRHQDIFAQCGGLHSVAQFNKNGALQKIFFDIGRHNALDKLCGANLISPVGQANNSFLIVSSRASFEMLQKSQRMGFLLVVFLGAVSTLAIDHAKKAGITLIGFFRKNRFNIYTHPERICLKE